MASSEKVKSTIKGRSFWGPPVWDIIHYLAFVYRPENKGAYINFLVLLTKLLPCDMCKKNLIAKFKKVHPSDYATSSHLLFYYTYLIHDMANKHITRYHPESPKVSPSFSTITSLYSRQTPQRMETVFWHNIHIFATTLKYEDGNYYKDMIITLCTLFPNVNGFTSSILDFLKHHPIEPYLRNNKDAFTYSYMLHDHIAQKFKQQIQSYENVKNFYFSALGEECNDCRVK